jgi:hypothetical protein
VTTATACIGWALPQERPVSLAVWGRASSAETDELKLPTLTAKYCEMAALHHSPLVCGPKAAWFFRLRYLAERTSPRLLEIS